MVIGIGFALIALIYLASADISTPAKALGAGLGFMIVGPLIGFGFFLFTKGNADADRAGEMQKQRQLLDIVKSRGQVRVNELAVEMGVPLDTVKNMVHQLVGLQVFSGYINWDDGVLFSSDASKLRDLKTCEKCGGNIQLAGKGVVQCPYCGTEYFLT